MGLRSLWRRRTDDGGAIRPGPHPGEPWPAIQGGALRHTADEPQRQELHDFPGCLRAISVGGQGVAPAKEEARPSRPPSGRSCTHTSATINVVWLATTKVRRLIQELRPIRISTGSGSSPKRGGRAHGYLQVACV